MTATASSAEVKAKIDVRPQRSQVFLVAVAVVAGISLICGAGLLALDKESGWGFAVLALIMLGAAGLFWTKSQSDVDLDRSHPTKIQLSDGTSVTTDSRTLRSVVGLQGMARLVQEMLTRRPLPEPDGMVDSNATLIPDSKDASIKIANEINDRVQAETNLLIDALGAGTDGPSFVVPQTVGADTLMPSSEEIGPENLNVRGS